MSSDAGRPIRADAQRNRARILAAAHDVFTAGGPQASTEDVARRAGVAVGTVFRHFPTKADLLRALMERVLQQIADEAAELATHRDPATALFEFFGLLVERTAASRTAVSLLPEDGTTITGTIGSVADTVARLLACGQHAGAIGAAVRTDEVLALLDSACHGALRGGWTRDLRDRALRIIFAGLAA